MAEQLPVRIAGKAHTGAQSIDVNSPYDGSLIAQVPRCDAGDVERAVGAARDALVNDPLPPWRRAEILDAAARLLADRVEDFAHTIAAEAAKPMKTARTEAQRAVSTFTFAATAARTLTGETVPLDADKVGEGRLGLVLRVPVGVIGAISPFNFPLNLVAHKLAPAIAAGCPVVLKPASQTPLSAIKLAELLLDECGLPEGWLHLVTGGGAEVGDALVEHPDVAMISFTGSPDVGWGIRAKAPRKKVGLELGNNAPLIIEPSGDWHTAAAKVKVAGYAHAGQSCISTQRIYVHRSIADGFTEELASLVAGLRVGDPLDEETDVSSVISPKECDRVAGWIDEAVASGATLVTGGQREGRLLTPAVLTGITHDMKVSNTEVFGPVVGIATYDDLGDALRMANDTRYGLQAGIFTNDLDAALRAARTLDFGGVLVNEVPTWRADQMPYGGVRDSGNTREGPRWAVREMTEERLVVFNG